MPAPCSHDELVAALSGPAPYPGRRSQVEVRETHISWVFLAGSRAYKLKKPLVLPFLDYGTPERRRRLCREEVRLNSRLAGDLYLGVRGVAWGDGGLELTSEADRRAVDYLVEMRRYDERRTLAARLERGVARPADMRALAGTLARFHAGAQPLASPARPSRAVLRRLGVSFAELLSELGEDPGRGRVQRLERFARAFLAGRRPVLEARAAGGMVRDGHGDLRCEHVLLGGAVRVVDCIEFDPALRRIDVADDLAFLVMDLTARGAAPLAAELVRAYRLAGGDPGDARLLAFYACLRALVRAKVELVRAAQRAPAARGSDAGQLIALAERFAWRARAPLVIAVCGLPATGKSTLAAAIGEEAGLEPLRSDVLRKRLAGVSANRPAPAWAYAQRFSRRTYRELGRAAAEAVAAEGVAVLDATFRRRADREAFTAGLAAAAPLLFVECRAPAALRASRAMSREAAAGSVSDATVAVVRRERDWESLREAGRRSRVLVDGERPVAEQRERLLAALDRRLASAAEASSSAGAVRDVLAEL